MEKIRRILDALGLGYQSVAEVEKYEGVAVGQTHSSLPNVRVRTISSEPSSSTTCTARWVRSSSGL